MAQHRLARRRDSTPRRTARPVDMVDIRTLLTHLMTPDATAAGRGPTGRSLAQCAAELIPAAREEPGRGYCQPCLSSHQTLSQRPADTR